MMKIKDLFVSEDLGIFTIFAEDFQQAFNSLFGGQTASNVNKMVLFLYGEKTVLPSVNSDNWGVIVEMIISQRLTGWEKQQQALTAEYSVLTPNKTTETVSHTADRNKTNNGERLSANKAFNDNNFSDNERNTDTATGTETETYNTERVTMGSNGSTPVSEVILQEVKLRQYNLQKAIITAIVNEITTDIYE